MTFKTADLCDDHSNRLSIAYPEYSSYGKLKCFHGEIVTLKLFEDNSLVREQVNSNGKGRVLVVDGGSSMRCALLGDCLAEKALENDWHGLVINGCIRDSADINKMMIGIKALGTHPLKSTKKGIGELNVPVTFSGIAFIPGHHLYADEDGIVCAPEALI